MTVDDFLWAILGAGFLTGLAYVRSEFHSYRARQGVQRERMAQQRLLWPTAASSDDTPKASALKRTKPALADLRRPARLNCCNSSR
jgi:hypothetical protein